MDRQTYKQAVMLMTRQTVGGQTVKWNDRQLDRQAVGHVNRQAALLIDRQMDRQADRKSALVMNEQTD